MVITAVTREWSSRLAHLTGLVEGAAPGPAWLWRIRIRILNYLLARYGEPHPQTAAETTDEPRIATDDVMPAPAEPLPPVVLGMALPAVGLEHPPRPAAAITPILENIHEVNDELRLARWLDPPPDQVWTWWRSAWCRRS